MCDQLKTRFEEWKEWLLGDDVHSIRNQIHSMMWDSAVYQSINEARAYAATDDEGRLQVNAMVHDLIDRGFFVLQMMAIRRLLDREKRDGDWSVISLWRLLDDIETHVPLLTRANILAALDLPYDYEKAREEVLKQHAHTSGPTWMDHDYKQCYRSEHAHKLIDALAGVTASQRNPCDTVQGTVVQWVKQRTEKCREVHQYVNKFLAHSATPESRAKLMDEETKMTLGQILTAHEVICQTAEFIGQNMFLRGVGNALPIPQFDQFEHFERPWVTGESIGRLRDWWRSYGESTDEWLRWDWQSEYAARDKCGGR